MKRAFVRRLYCLILLITFTCALQALANPYIPYNVSQADGLKGQSVYKFFKDKRGNMWIGTDLGISSFNGHSITNYTMDCVPPLSNTNDIIEYPKGEILSCCANGVYLTDQNTTSSSRILTDIKNATCFCLAGTTLLIGSERGIWMYKNHQHAEQILIEKNAISRSNIVNDMVYDGKDGVWLTTNTHVVYFHLKDKTFTKHAIFPEDVPEHLSKLVLLGDNLYIGTPNYGIIRFNRKTKTASPWDIGISCNVIADLTSNGKNLLYVSTDGNGAFVIDVAHEEITAHLNHLQPDFTYNNSTYTFWQDCDTGTYWWGFFENGFCHTFQTSPVCSTYAFKELDTRNICVRSFAIHNDEKVIGTRNGVWYVAEGKGTIRYYPPAETGTGIITDIQYFSGKYVIATFGNGLYLLDPLTQNISNEKLDAQLHFGQISKIVMLPDCKHIVALSNLGLYFLDEDFRIVQKYNSKNSELPDAFLIDMLFDSEGKGWISSMKNLSLYDPTTRLIQSHNFHRGFFNDKGDMTFCLCHNNDIIAASRDSVFRCKTDLSHVRTYDLYNRLHVKRLFFITESPNHVFWVGTDKGIFLFDKDFENFLQLDEAENMPPLVAHKKGVYWDEQGTAWIGTEKGLIYITPEQYRQFTQKQHHALALDGIDIYSQPASPNNVNNINDSKTISLPLYLLSYLKGDYQLKFNITEHGFIPTSQHCYEWAIDKDNFQTCTSTESIQLKNISFGTHTLRIRLAGAPETETLYKIRIYPSVSFYVILAITLLLVILAFKLYKIRKKQQRLKNAFQRKHALDLKILEERTIKNMKLEEEAKEREKEEYKIKSMYSKAKLSENEYIAMHKKVKSYMVKDRPYVNADFKLTDLAKAIGCSAAYLSQMFNIHTQQTFLDFINHYRIEEFKRLVKDPAYNKYTITAICELCGFKRSTFFSAFKKHENCTPSQYLQQNKIFR